MRIWPQTGDDGIDLFVHHGEIQGEGFKSPPEGEAFTFKVMQGEKDPKGSPPAHIVG